MSQFFLMSLMEKFIHLCRTNNITFWIDDGTLLGYHRNRNIIPWDYDIDVCMMNDDYQAFLHLFDHAEYVNGLCCIKDLYNDATGCMFVSDRFDNDIGIDIVAYCKQDNIIKNMMSEQTLHDYPFEYYDKNFNDVFPLKQEIFCGNYVNVPNNYIVVLELTYGKYMEYTPEGIDWLKIHDNKFNTSPFIEIKKIKNDYISKYIKEMKCPFIINKCPDFTFNIDELSNSFLSEKHENIWGYTDIDKIIYEYVDPHILLDNWSNDKLLHILVDTESTKEELYPVSVQQDIKNNKCYVLTKQNNLTNFHVDPDFGGGWMYLAIGTKLWWFISPSDMEYLLANEISIDKLKNISFTELLTLCDSYLWGKVFIGEITGGDFIYFPKKWAHRVFTYDKSFGISGYYDPDN